MVEVNSGHHRKQKNARRNTDSRVEQMNERFVVKGKHFGKLSFCLTWAFISMVTWG